MNPLLEHLRFGIKIMEGLACLVGFLCWARLSPRFWKAFPVYLLLITCTEFAGWYLKSNGISGSKYLYQFFAIPLQFLFMQFLYHHNLKPQFKRLVIWLFFFYVLSFVIEYIVIRDSSWIWMSFSQMIGAVSILVLAVTWYIQLLQSEIADGYRQDMFFWVNLGLVIFYVGTIPHHATVSFLYKKHLSLAMLLYWLFVIFNYVMYALFITAFLCSRKPRPS